MLTDHQSNSRGLGYIGLFSLLFFLVPFLQFTVLIPCVTDVLSLILFIGCAFLFHISTIGTVVALVFGGPRGLLCFVYRFPSGGVRLEVEKIVVDIFPSSLVFAPQVVNNVVHCGG